jgi:hypothetical protein
MIPNLLLPLKNITSSGEFNVWSTCGHLNFRIWFMKNLLFEQKVINLSKQNFVENKTQIMQCLKNAVNFLVA